MISKRRQELFGIGIIAVLLAHSTLILNVPGYIKILFGNGAIWAVRMFFFLSGIGLVWSANKKGLNIRDYYKRRIDRVIVPFLIVAPIFYLWQELFVHFRPVRFFSKISLLDFWIFGGGHVWYLAVLIPLYILFPLMYYILHKGKSRFVFVIIIWFLFDLIIHCSQPDYCRIIENAFTSVFAFMIGILISDKADNINRGGGSQYFAEYCHFLSLQF